ncbi:MAG: hypothetical protein WCA46_04090 [Actinocatenispora sp.]
MSELERLRHGLADLAEQAGPGADLYERSLRVSRRMTRRRLVGACVATVVCAVVGLGGVLTVKIPHPSVYSGARDTASARTPSVPPSGHGRAGPGGVLAPPSASGTPSGSAVSDGCPVTAGTLLAALRESEIYRRLGEPDDLTDVECYRGYAVAVTVRGDDPEGQATGIVFGYYEARSYWVALNLGSDGYCDGYVPPDISSHFRDAGCPSA